MRALQWMGLWGSISLVVGCSSGAETDCGNGVDDDKDGLVDSFDSDCSSDPADDTDPGTGPGPFIHDGLATQVLNVSVSIAIRQLGGTIEDENPYCDPPFSLCDCSLNLIGDGAFLEGADNVGVFLGEWVLDNTDCNPGLQGAIWYSLPDRSVYHTYTWSTDGNKLEQWVVHEDEGTDEPIPEEESPSSNHQFYVSQMGTTYNVDQGTATYVEAGSMDDSESMITQYVTTTFSVDFN